MPDLGSVDASFRLGKLADVTHRTDIGPDYLGVEADEHIQAVH